MKKQTDTRFFVIILILRKAVKFSSLNFPNDDHAQVPFFFSLGDISASFPNLHFGAAIAYVSLLYGTISVVLHKPSAHILQSFPIHFK